MLTCPLKAYCSPHDAAVLRYKLVDLLQSFHDVCFHSLFAHSLRCNCRRHPPTCALTEHDVKL